MPTNLEEFNDPHDENSLPIALVDLQARVSQVQPACLGLLVDIRPLWFFGAAASQHAQEAACLTVYEHACAEVALGRAATLITGGQIDGVMFDTWELRCWAIRGLRGIHTGNRTQVGGGLDERTAEEHSPLNRAIIADLRFRTAQFPQYGGTNCVGGWKGACSACYTDVRRLFSILIVKFPWTFCTF